MDRVGGFGKAVQIPAKSGDKLRARSARGTSITERIKALQPEIKEGSFVALFGRDDDNPFFIVRVEAEPYEARSERWFNESAGIGVARGDLMFTGLELVPVEPGSKTFEFALQADGKKLRPAMPVRLDEVRVAPIKMVKGQPSGGGPKSKKSKKAKAAAPPLHEWCLDTQAKESILHWCSMFDA